MKVEYVDTLDNIPKEQKSRGVWVKLVKDFQRNDKPAVTITLETVDEAKRGVMSILQHCTRNALPIKVWRKQNIIYMLKEELDDGSEDV